jgi:glycosyltransferase involved in cell wall biosynthesis
MPYAADLRWCRGRGPSIPAIAGVADRPFWSVMIPARDSAATIEETLFSVLRSGVDLRHAQVEVVDDCSRDIDLERLVAEVGRGRIGYVRHERPLGAPATFNHCIARARGRWIHLLHADDLVLHGFYERLRRAIDAEPSAGAALCRWRYVDEAGRRIGLAPLEQTTRGVVWDLLSKLAVTNRIRAPAIIVKRQFYEELGGFRPDLGHASDWEMWMRLAARAAVVYEPAALVCYRLHAGSHTERLRRRARDVVDASRAIRAARELPVAIDPALRAEALERLGWRAVANARSLVRGGAVDGAVAQLEVGVP